MIRRILVLIACLGMCWQTLADDFCGAEGIIQQLCITVPEAAGLGGKEKPKTPLDVFREKVKAFGDGIEELPGPVAVDIWIDLVDEYNDILDGPRSQSGSSGYMFGVGNYDQPRSGFDLLITVLPPPSTWPLLAETIHARPIGEGQKALREHCLRLLTTLLLADEEAQHRELEAIDQFVAEFTDTWQQKSIAQQLQSLSDALARLSDNPLLEVESFERRLDYVERISNPDDLGILSMTGLATPDLVTLVGEVKAESLLRRAIVLPVLLEVTDGEETQRLARRLALELIGKLRKPQWKLCFSMEASDLYEALDMQFIKLAQKKREEAVANDPTALVEMLNRQRPRMDEHELKQARGGAQWHYLMHLIAENRLGEANIFAQEFTEQEGPWAYHMYGRYNRDYTAGHAIASSPHAARALEFVHELLAGKPTLPFWGLYGKLSRQLKKTDRAIDLMKASVDSEFSSQIKWTFDNLYQSLLLGDDRVDEVIAMLRLRMNKEADQRTRSVPTKAADDLAKLGRLLHRTELIDEAIDRLRQLRDESNNYQASSTLIRVAELYSRAGDGPTAELLLGEELAVQLQRAQSDGSFWSNTPAREILRSLTTVYHRANRHADVLVLADKATWWGVKDLIEVQDDYQWSGSRNDISLALIVATALADVGRNTEARHIVEALLDKDPTLDPAYEIYVKLEGLGAIHRFETMMRRDKVEERPLIWKARALLDAQRVDEAAQAIEEAIARDPSDEDQRSGLRLKAYEILADVRSAQGNKQEEQRLRKLVEAVRLAEKADELCAADLIRPGIDLYLQALELFDEAYCIHLRVAHRLDEIGRTDEARQHFRIGFGLMPRTFGRLSQGCSYGRCQALFGTELAMSIAEEVFTENLREDEVNPKLHILLGFLREQQDRSRDALTHYRRAIELDPENALALQRLLRLAQLVHVPAVERDNAALTLFRLRPLPTGFGGGWRRSVRDLTLLWETVANIEKLEVKNPKTLYTFAAAREQLEKVEAAQIEAGQRPGQDRFGGGGIVMSRSNNWQARRTPKPGEALAEHSAISQLVRVYAIRISQR